MRICESLATQASPNLGINNYVFGITCIVYSDVCLWYRVREMLCTVICVWGTGWGKIYCLTVGSRIWVRVYQWMGVRHNCW